MAAAGGGAGYVRLQTPDSGVSQATQFWGAQESKRAGDEKLADEREGVRKDQEIKDWEDAYDVKAGDFESKYTGFKSYDDMTTDFSLNTTAQYVDLQRQAKEALLSGNTSEKSRIQGEMIKVKGAFKEASKSQAALGTLYQGFQKASQEGKVSGASKDFSNAMEAGFKDMNIALRYKNGQLVYTGIDKEGKIITIPHQDVIDGSFNWIEKQNLYGDKGLIENMIGNLGTTTNSSIDGYTKTTSQVWDDNLQGKAAISSIETLMGTDDVMADLLYQVSKGKISKRVGFDEKDYDLVKQELLKQVKGGYDQSIKKDFESSKYSTDVNAALKRQEMADAKNNPKTKSQEEQDYGARKWNINQVRDNGDVSFFSAGDFEWNGSTYEAVDAKLIGDNVVIRTKDKEIIKIPVNNEVGLNDLFNAFEGKTYGFDKVQSVEALQWRDARTGSQGAITDVLSKQYSASGLFIGEETPFRKSLQKLYPDAKIEETGFGTNKILVNEQEIDLDNLSKEQVEQAIRKAVGETRGSAKTTAKDLINKYK
jgi:hypothetical protein